MSSDESESSLEDGSDGSSFRCLRRFFFFLIFFFLALDYDEEVSDESNNEGSGSGFTSSFCLSSCFEISIYRVSLLSSNRVTISVGSIVEYFQGSKFPAQKIL